MTVAVARNRRGLVFFSIFFISEFAEQLETNNVEFSVQLQG